MPLKLKFIKEDYMKKSFLVLACIIVLTMGLLLFSCQKKEEPVAPAATEEEAAPAATEEAATPETSGEEKPATGGY